MPGRLVLALAAVAEGETADGAIAARACGERRVLRAVLAVEHGRLLLPAEAAAAARGMGKGGGIVVPGTLDFSAVPEGEAHQPQE